MNSHHQSALARFRVRSAVAGWVRGFQVFLKRGNIVDLAVGVMIGAAFGKIVSSLVADVLTPPLGLLIGEVNFSALKLRLGGSLAAPVTVNYGSFIQALLDFAIMAAVLFGFVRLVQWSRGPGAPAALTTDQQLLAEIRDELRAARTADATAAENSGSLR